MANYIKPFDFLKEARRHFEFLSDRDFLGPEEGEYSLSYRSGALGVEVHYDDRDGRVLTIVRSSVGDRNPRASLQCLYVLAKLGPAQDIKEMARSGTRTFDDGVRVTEWAPGGITLLGVAYDLLVAATVAVAAWSARRAAGGP